jgi:hypothetical protein
MVKFSRGDPPTSPRRRESLRGISMGDQRLIDELPYPNSTAENAGITFTTAVNVIQAFLGILSEAVSQAGPYNCRCHLATHDLVRLGPLPTGNGLVAGRVSVLSLLQVHYSANIRKPRDVVVRSFRYAMVSRMTIGERLSCAILEMDVLYRIHPEYHPSTPSQHV